MRIIPYVETRRSFFAPWARRSAVLSISVLAVALAAHWFALLATPALFMSLFLAAGLAMLALVFAAFAMPNVWYKGFRGGADLVLAVACAVLVLLPFGGAALWSLTHAPLTDISTDIDDAPAFDQALLSRTSDMNALASFGDDAKSEQLAAYPHIAGRRYEVPIESVREVVEAVFDARGWPMLGPYIVGTPERFSIETTVSTPVLALPSDVVVRLVSDNDATLVDMRAASRYGAVDFGQNADLIVGFLTDLDSAIAARTPSAPPAQAGQ